MRCEDAMETIHGPAGHAPAALHAAREHAASCRDCSAALRAVEALRELSDALVPEPRADAAERAIDRALLVGSVGRSRRSFVYGAVNGAALAASLAAVAVAVWLQRPPAADDDAPASVPEVRVALNMPRAVTVTLESPEPLADAEVRVVLRGAVALDGYEGHRELRWSTTLERGINQLTLPVVALDATGGQVLVEVAHGAKRRTFVLDVRTATAI